MVGRQSSACGPETTQRQRAKGSSAGRGLTSLSARKRVMYVRSVWRSSLVSAGTVCGVLDGWNERRGQGRCSTWVSGVARTTTDAPLREMVRMLLLMALSLSTAACLLRSRVRA